MTDTPEARRVGSLPPTTEERTTGVLDRCISEMFWLADNPRDEITVQTVKHHAEDMVLAGNAILKKLGFPQYPRDESGQFVPTPKSERVT